MRRLTGERLLSAKCPLTGSAGPSCLWPRSGHNQSFATASESRRLITVQAPAMPSEIDLNLAEIPYDSGALRFRYTRYMASDGTRWVRHGLFVSYHENGIVSSEGGYIEGKEDGIWRVFHENGQLASEGSYRDGDEVGTWRFWGPDGREQPPTKHDH